MKRFNVLIAFLMLISGSYAQKLHQGSKNNVQISGDNLNFGKEVKVDDALSDVEMTEVYQRLSLNDTVINKFRATVTDVCQAKGCWMKLRLNSGLETMVRFKDYGFFVPMDISGREVIVNGMAYVGSMSVAEQKHYAEDAGMAEADIAKISKPKKIFGFEADGVVLMQE